VPTVPVAPVGVASPSGAPARELHALVQGASRTVVASAPSHKCLRIRILAFQHNNCNARAVRPAVLHSIFRAARHRADASSHRFCVERTDTAERVLIVEDDTATRIGLAELVRAWGFLTDEAEDGESAMQKVTTFRPAIVVTDMVMPRMDGLELLRALKDQLADISLIILTAQGTVDTAVEAIKDGAFDYLTKPVDTQRLRVLLDKAVERQETLREVKELRRQLREHGSYGRIVGNSPGIRGIYRVIEQSAPTSASVLVWGESGTGKELVAQTVHALSPRASFPYVGVNCAAIPETLLESEIFGHEKGAFTGAQDRRLGVFELAHRGTLFLDEISEMMPATQAKLLRVLQERSFRRLGGRQEISVDVRVIAATNRNPEDSVREGKLREDLFYRLNVFSVHLPPLRERREDIPLLVQTFLTEFNQRNSKALRALSQEAMRALEQHVWPGNIRELRNVIERATILAEGEFIELKHLPPTLVARAEANLPTLTISPGMTVDEAERRLILLTLEHTHNNKTRAAEILGISLKTLHNKLNRLKSEQEELMKADS
jgi:DNA-binding NtrC family response regulator